MPQDQVDVLIVGAGLSGICAAYYVQTRCPQRSYAIIESRDTTGGTWDLFRYPGVRSDSDMYTLGYSFRPPDWYRMSMRMGPQPSAGDDMDQHDDMVSAKVPRGAKRRARTRADLLNAARQVFARRGFHEATLAEITDTAGIGVGTFYLHFADKDALFAALLDNGLVSLRAQIIAEVSRRPQPTLSVVLHVILQAAYGQRDLFRVAVMSGNTPHRFGARDLLNGMFMTFLEHVPDLAPFAAADIPLLAQLLTGLLMQAIIWWFDQDEPDPDHMAEQVLAVMQRGFPAALFTVAVPLPGTQHDEE